MQKFIVQRVKSFRHALRGGVYSLRTQPNTWIHSGATLLVIGLATWLSLSAQDWALLILAIGLVWAAEFMNTAVESVVDLVSPHQNWRAGAAKDAGAAAVLAAAGSAALIGLLVMGPPLWQKLAALLGWQ
ncbi:MAG: diacylglycerol kinase family protein [Anaerolineales bacterium]|jgi:diacylglycerol kinase|nr:diacylglycerol kinase family protein [Anaerolineales bacterium]